MKVKLNLSYFKVSRQSTCFVIYILFFNISFYGQEKTNDTLVKVKNELIQKVNFCVQDNVNLASRNNVKIFDIKYKYFFKDFDIKESKLKMPGYKLFDVLVLPIVTTDGNNEFQYADHPILDNLVFKKNLIAYKDDKILILSGRIYNSLYSNLFKFDNNFESYKIFLNLKMSTHCAENISFEKKNKKFIYFSIKKEDKKTYYKFEISSPDFIIELGSKISGKYKKNELIKIY